MRKRIIIKCIGILLLSSLMINFGCQEDTTAVIEPDLDTQMPAFNAPAVTLDTRSKDVQALSEQLAAYEVFSIETTSLFSFVSENPGKPFRLNLGDTHAWEITLEPSNLLAPNFELDLPDGNGAEIVERLQNSFYSGTTTDGGEVLLMLGENMLSGVIRKDGKEVHIESGLAIGLKEMADYTIAYTSDAIKLSDEEIMMNNELAEQIKLQRNERSRQSCGGEEILELALVFTYSCLSNGYGSDIFDAMSHVFSIFRDIAARDNYFDTFQISYMKFVTSESRKPFAEPQDLSEVRDNFQDWANGPNGISHQHDLGIALTYDYYYYYEKDHYFNPGSICTAPERAYGAISMRWHLFVSFSSIRNRFWYTMNHSYNPSNTSCLCDGVPEMDSLK